MWCIYCLKKRRLLILNMMTLNKGASFMNFYKKLSFYFHLVSIVLISTAYLEIHPEFGCIDKGYHCTCEPENKPFTYVYCTCPCSKFPHVDKRNKCLKCKHYHAPARDRVVQYDPATDSVCIAP